MIAQRKIGQKRRQIFDSVSKAGRRLQKKQADLIRSTGKKKAVVGKRSRNDPGGRRENSAGQALPVRSVRTVGRRRKRGKHRLTFRDKEKMPAADKKNELV
jgi:hypothetical protein